MQDWTAILTINTLSLAAILVEPDQTYPDPSARRISEAQRYFPTLPIIQAFPCSGAFYTAAQVRTPNREFLLTLARPRVVRKSTILGRLTEFALAQ